MSDHPTDADSKKKTDKTSTRSGRGRPNFLEGGGRAEVYLDRPTRKILFDLGEGNLSEGIRRSGKIIARIGVVGSFLLLDNEDLGIDIPELQKKGL